MIIQGYVLAILKNVPDNTFHGVFCDPPYGLSFMGKKWDYSVPGPEVWAEMLRVCRPGAALLSFGGSRTFHRLTCAIEDGGWEIRDCLTWLYGSGFPKSLNVSKALDKAAGATREVVGINEDYLRRKPNGMQTAGSTAYGYSQNQQETDARITAPATDLAKEWDGYGTALKPGWEPIILARKPLDGTVAANVTKWGCGALAIDACRIGDTEQTINRFTDGAKPWGNAKGEAYESVKVKGRFPANLILDEAAGEALDATVGNRPGMSGGGKHKKDYPGGLLGGIDSEGTARGDSGGDSGGPSRFFYSSKVSTKEREAGCENLPLRSAGECTDREDGSEGLDSPRAGAGRTGGNRNHHPTLKPSSLTQYLSRLIMPPGKEPMLLVPFAGTGSECIGATLAGWDVAGIELDPEYIAIAEARIKHWTGK